jgi:hypothetical protein
MLRNLWQNPSRKHNNYPQPSNKKSKPPSSFWAGVFLFFTFSIVLSAGIEPALQLPQSCVLSIERRKQYRHYTLKSKPFKQTVPRAFHVFTFLKENGKIFTYVLGMHFGDGDNNKRHQGLL